MKIGIVGPENSLERIRPMLNYEYAFAECVEYPCSLRHVVGILPEIQKELDGIIFTGARYFDYASRNITAEIPWTYPRRSLASLLCALFEAHLSGRDIRRISFDLHNTSTDKMLEILTERIGLEKEGIALFRYNDTERYQEYLDNSELLGKYAVGASRFHLDNLRSGKADVCLTDSLSVAALMEKNGYAAFSVIFTREDFTQALNTLRFRHQEQELQRRENHEEAVILLTIHLREDGERQRQAYTRIQSVCRIETILLEFVQGIGASVEKQSDMRYLIYSAKGGLDLSTDRFENLDFAEHILAISGVERLSIGIGFDVMHGKAKLNAEKAGKSADQQQFSCLYFRESDEMIRGPLLIQPYSSGKDFNRIMLERVSLNSGVGMTALNKLAQAQRQFGFQTITSSELAQMTGMSLNNIHRIIVKLENSGYVEIVGNQPCNGHGRPRRLIRFNFALAPSKEK